MIDWDKLVNVPVMGIFGEPVKYMPGVGLPFTIHGTFHEAYKSLDLVGGTGMTTEMPALGISLSEFPTPPKQKDRLYITPSALHGGGTYVVKEVQKNGIGSVMLLLNWVSA